MTQGKGAETSSGDRRCSCRKSGTEPGFGLRGTKAAASFLQLNVGDSGLF